VQRGHGAAELDVGLGELGIDLGTVLAAEDRSGVGVGKVQQPPHLPAGHIVAVEGEAAAVGEVAHRSRPLVAVPGKINAVHWDSSKSRHVGAARMLGPPRWLAEGSPPGHLPPITGKPTHCSWAAPTVYMRVKGI
jgi:hypothetical protein